MIDCLDSQRRQQHQQLRSQFVTSNPSTSPMDGQVIQQQQVTALQRHQQHHQPLYQKHLETTTAAMQPMELQQLNNNNELIGYYFGSISRETAEWILKNHGNHQGGAYLLRSSGPKDDFVLSLMVAHEPNNETSINNHQQVANNNNINNNNNNNQVNSQNARHNNLSVRQAHLEVLHYKIVETEDSFVALHGQVGDEKFATIDELIEKAQGVATKPKWPIQRQSLESQILPPTFWGLTVDQVRLAILIKAKQWGFPLSIFQQPSMPSYQLDSPSWVGPSCQQPRQQYNINNNNSSPHQVESTINRQYAESSLNGGDSVSQVNGISSQVANNNNVTTLNNETIRTLIYKSLHEFQPWFHGKISREEAERRIEDGQARDGRFLVRERDNYSYAMCISHKKTTKHYRIDVLATGELAIQDGRKFTSLMALISHYTIMSDGLWCALTEPCPRPIQSDSLAPQVTTTTRGFQPFPSGNPGSNNIYCIPPSMNGRTGQDGSQMMGAHRALTDNTNSSVHHSSSSQHDDRNHQSCGNGNNNINGNNNKQQASNNALICPNQSAAVLSIKAPIKEWLHTINHKWSQLIASKTNAQHQSSLNSFLFGSSNPLNNHCHHHRNHHNHHRHHNHTRSDGHGQRRRCKNSNCPKHNQGSSVTEISNVGQQRHSLSHKAQTTNNCQQTSMTMTKPNGATCDCYCAYQPATAAAFEDGQQQQQLQTMIQSRMLPMPAGGGGGCGSVKSLPPNSNMILQYISNNGACDQLVAGAGGGGATHAAVTPVPPQALDYTKALLKGLPQNSGFMLDSQSFIGSPLFAVKQTHTSTCGNTNATIDGFASRSVNGAGAGNCSNNINGMGASGSGGGGGSQGSSGSGRFGNNVQAQQHQQHEGKLISPARSVSSNLNNHRTATATAAAANPYALNTDIYGSQTSTAIVNDHLLTSSSSSSGNNNNNHNTTTTASNLGQRQQSIDLKRNCVAAAAPPSNLGQARYGTQGAARAQQDGLVLVSGSGGGQSNRASNLPARVGNDQVPPLQQQQHANYQGAVSLLDAGQQMPGIQQQQPPTSRVVGVPVQHAGPIFCGQHAGPAYRYTNCTGDQSLLRPCYHSRALSGSNAGDHNHLHQHRAVDDLQLMTPSSQLGGPAALTKFVQFQDGQCLRTHRDTRSIQMAYLLSRQEALNVLNSRNSCNNNGTPGSAAGSMRTSQHGLSRPMATAQAHNYPALNGHHQNNNNGNSSHQRAQPTYHLQRQQQTQFTSANRFAPGNNQQNHLMLAGVQDIDKQARHLGGREAAAVGAADDFDLMDCDGKGFQFKYDPKLIKSSSIETLCGAAGEDDHDDECPEIDLSHFKTNSELLMSLKSCWPTSYNGGDQQQQQQSINILSPIIPSSVLNSKQNDQNNSQEQDLALFKQNDFDCLASLMNGQHRLSASENQNSSGGGDAGGQLDESIRRKHDLDDLTTSLLAELTASLKAQVDLKNKRSGLCTDSIQNSQQESQQRANTQPTGQSNGFSHHHEYHPEDKNVQHQDPRDLVNEFDTLVSDSLNLDK